MTMFYLDSSALLKRYQKESGSEFIDQLFEYLIKSSAYLFTSVLTEVEFTSAIFRLSREQKLTLDEAKGAIYFFEIESISRVSYLPFDSEIIYSAKNILSNHPLKSHDAIQLASALEARYYYDDLYFVADDEKLCRAAEQENFNVLRPRKESSKQTLSKITGKV